MKGMAWARCAEPRSVFPFPLGGTAQRRAARGAFPWLQQFPRACTWGDALSTVKVFVATGS